jgi:4-hydroxy-tetrahydrodipicolinate reductase
VHKGICFMKKISLGLFGAKGKMGREIIECSSYDERFKITSTKNADDVPLRDFFQNIDVAIDFSVKEAFQGYLEGARFYKVPLLVGTTGIDAPKEEYEIPLMISPNMSLAVAFMGEITKKMAAFFKDFDIEISEEHHRDKIDAPSGTSLMLGRAAAQGKGIDFKPSIERSHKRHQDEIGFSVIRAGQLPGTHVVHFISNEERISVMHTAYTRSIFAKGALEAAFWLVNQQPGLYTMKDFLNAHVIF